MFPLYIIYLLLSFIESLQPLFAIDTSSCGTSKQCVFSSSNCNPMTTSCLVFSYSWNAMNNSFDMEISGSSGAGSQYVAVAFSPSGLMQESDLYFCTGSDLMSGAIEMRQAPPTVGTLPPGISNIATATTAGRGECLFTREASVTKTINSAATTFDLSDTTFHVLLATGPYNAGSGMAIHTARYSSRPYNFTNTVTTTTTTSAPPTGISNAAAGCGDTKGCYHSPNSCTPGSTGCMFASWIYNEASSTFDFEIIGDGSPYAAIAFATTNQMVNADLYYCTSTQLRSGAIGERHLAPSVSNSLPSEITNDVAGVYSGVVKCSFNRQHAVSKLVQNGFKQEFNLLTTSYYLLYALGSHDGSGILLRHSSRSASNGPIDFKTTSLSRGNTKTLNLGLIKAHACFMLIAWMTCASVGVIIARHFKPLWHDQRLLGEKVWFQLHRSLMITVLLCTVLGFIFIFVAIGKYSETAGAHPVLGIIVTALAIINPIMALFRPHPGAPSRITFNWAHWCVGSVARVLALATIFLGVDLTLLNLPEWDTWVLLAFVIIQVVTEIVLEIHSAIYGHIAVYRRPKPEESVSVDGDEKKVDPPPKGSRVKYVILVVYTVVNIGFLLTFIVSVGIN